MLKFTFQREVCLIHIISSNEAFKEWGYDGAGMIVMWPKSPKKLSSFYALFIYIKTEIHTQRRVKIQNLCSVSWQLSTYFCHCKLTLKRHVENIIAITPGTNADSFSKYNTFQIPLQLIDPVPTNLKENRIYSNWDKLNVVLFLCRRREQKLK